MAKRALTVDDSRTMRDMVAFTLQNAGYEVIQAEDGKDALSKLGDQKVDVIITDLNMPNMNGLELIRALRANPAHAGTPMLNQNRSFTHTLQEAADTANQLSNTISGMVVGMQFQDRTSQHIDNCVSAMQVILKEWHNLHNTTQRHVPIRVGQTGIERPLVEGICQQFRLGEFKNDFLHRLEEEEIIADASLYGGKKPSASPEAGDRESNNAPTATSNDDDDDIELF